MSLWDDVAHDEITTRRAVERLEETADRLSALTRSREHLADDARVGWQGAGREGFDRRLAGLVTRSEELIHQFRAAAATIESDLEAAVLEQRRREQRRAEIEDHTASLVGSE
jgi:uncharacterized protein YukE